MTDINKPIPLATDCLLDRIKTALREAIACEIDYTENHYEPNPMRMDGWLALLQELEKLPKDALCADGLPQGGIEHEIRFQQFFAQFHHKWAPDTAEKRAEFMYELITLFRHGLRQDAGASRH